VDAPVSPHPEKGVSIEEKESNCLTQFFWGLLIFVVLSIGSGYLGYRYMTRPYYSNAVAYTEWKVGGAPHTVTVTVLGPKGEPVSGVETGVADSSGGSMGTTDRNGKVKVTLAEADLVEITINRVSVMECDPMFSPSPAPGLLVNVRVKDLKAIGR
jgi:hypothetical protein